MKVLLIGGGGREHALGWKIAQSPQLSRLYLIPGNPGLEQISAKYVETLAVNEGDIQAIVDLTQKKCIDLVIVGPEVPLAAGLADALSQVNIPCFGPSQAAARLESSKGFMKDLCKVHDIPTARYDRFHKSQDAIKALDDYKAPYVIKADGLAAGKGVIIAQNKIDAVTAIEDMMQGEFGEAGHEIVLEEFLEGEEASFFVITDGETILPMMAIQDHKRVGEGDIGPNTGGMGAYGPAPVFTPEIRDQTMELIINPTVKAMANAQTPFCGVLFAGLMITNEGPKLIEYNVRFGDPECQVMIRLMESDLLPVLMAAATGNLQGHDIKWSDKAGSLVVMAAHGYPGAYNKGSEIKNLSAVETMEDIVPFHAGTKIENGRLIANGGRVLNMTATGNTIKEALSKTYAAVEIVDWPDGFYRRDIGWRAIDKKHKTHTNKQS